MKYRYDKAARPALEKYLESLAGGNNDDETIGDFEADPDCFTFETGSGNSQVSYHINQETGKVVVEYKYPDSKKNDWHKYESHIKPMLQKHVVSQNGGRRKTRRATKKRSRN